MRRTSTLALVFMACLGSVPTAFAQQARTDAPQPTLPGAQVEHGQDGFELVTLGVWQRPGARDPLEPEPTASRLVDRASRDEPGAGSHLRRAAYLHHVQAAEAQYGLPAGLLDALIWTESRYNPLAVSSAGAAGLGQLMPETARAVGVTNRFDPSANVQGAARYLRQMLDRFGMVHLALAAYNAGPGAVERVGGIPRNGETPGYVRSVLEFWGTR